MDLTKYLSWLHCVRAYCVGQHRGCHQCVHIQGPAGSMRHKQYGWRKFIDRPSFRVERKSAAHSHLSLQLGVQCSSTQDFKVSWYVLTLSSFIFWVENSCSRRPQRSHNALPNLIRYITLRGAYSIRLSLSVTLSQITKPVSAEVLAKFYLYLILRQYQQTKLNLQSY